MCQRRPQIRISLLDLRDGIVPDDRIDPIIRRLASGLVQALRRTVDLDHLAQPLDLPALVRPERQVRYCSTSDFGAMGWLRAMLAVIVIDRNRAHPTTPIQNCGGALRAFTRRHRQGELDLRASIFGIWGREGRMQ